MFSLFLIKFSWRWNLNNFNRPKIFTSMFHLTLITCFLGLIWTWLFSNSYTSTSFNVSLVNIRFLSFSLHSRPGYVSASESITRRKSPRASFPHLRYYRLTLQPNYGASYYGPGAYLQEDYPNFLKSVAAQDGLRYYRHDLQCPDRADCVSFS